MALYFKNVSTDGAWENPANWFTDSTATTNAGLSGGPWQADDWTKDEDLHRSGDSEAAEDYISISASIGDGFEITGECTIGDASSPTNYNTLNNNNNIHGGTFSGAGFSNNNNSYIYGGTFSGAGFSNNNNSYIYGGTFSGAGFSNNNNSYIYGGTFSGDGFSNNNSYIYGGTFSGAGFSNNNNSSIYGGTFSGDAFNGGSIYGGTFSGDAFNGGSIYGGTFSGDAFNGGSIYGGTFSGDGFYNSGYIYGGNWLESGTMDVDSYDDNGGDPTTTTTRITGTTLNPQVWDPTSQSGLTTLRIPGQDVLGGGIL